MENNIIAHAGLKPPKIKNFTVPILVPEQRVKDQLDNLTLEYSPWLSCFEERKGWTMTLKFDREEDCEGTYKGSKKLHYNDFQSGLARMAHEAPERFANILSGELRRD